MTLLAQTKAPELQAGVQSLPHLFVLRARGPEAASFLHNMLTQDALLMPLGTGRLASLCSAKGRMMASGWLLKPEADLLLWVIDASVGPATLKRLNMFKLRMKVVLDDASTELACVGELLAASSIARGGLVTGGNGGWTFGLGTAGGIDLDLHLGGRSNAHAITSDWALAEVLTGIGQVSLATAEAFVPQMLNHESVGGVNFKKGCYPGQEVVARSQFRGAIKRRGVLVAGASAMKPGDAVLDTSVETNEVGLVCNAAQKNGFHYALASVQTSAIPTALACNGVELSRFELPYPLLLDI